MRVCWPITLAALIAALATVVWSGPALAHENRDVADKYRFVVGWSTEPAYLGQRNGVDLTVTRKDNNEPVEGLEKTLQLELLFGGIKRQAELRAVFRQPGKYTADLIPTREGDYRFRFFGTVEGAPVDVTFDSADGKFDGVRATTAIQFPSAEASAGQLGQAVQAAEQQAVQAQAAARLGQTLGAGGLIVGLLGLGVGGWALWRGRRLSRSA